MPTDSRATVQGVAFDVFGTVADRHGSIARDIGDLADQPGCA